MKNIAIRTLYKLISKDFTPNAMVEILEPFYKVWPWNKVKGFVFSVIRLKTEVNSFTGKFLQVLLFPSNAVVKTDH